MSSKKNKCKGEIWYICDVCKAIMHMKDTRVHKDNSCPVNDNVFMHSYIKDEMLHTDVHVLELKDNKNIPCSELDDFVFIPINALQLMKVPVGDPVLICNKSGQKFTSFVKNVWPLAGKNLSIFLTKEAIELNFFGKPDSVVLRLFNQPVSFAKQIIIKCEADFDFIKESNFLPKIKNKNMKNIYTVGNKLSYIHYGKLLKFTIFGIEPFPQNEIAHVGEKNIESEYFAMTETTTWNMYECTSNSSIGGNEWKKIGGLDHIIAELEGIVVSALTDQSIVPGMFVTRGVLIFGPGGTGKTSLVEMIVQKLNINIVRIDVSLLFSKYLGEAERQLVCSFEKAIKLSPSVILIDEIDVLCCKSSSRNDQGKRIVATLSMLLDRLHKSINQSILVFGTTSRINDVPKTLRRPGRFGKEIEIQVPNPGQRRDILQVYLKDINHNLEENDLQEIANSTHGFVGSDLLSLVSKAVLRNYNVIGGDCVTMSDFLWAMTKVKPSAMKEVLIEVPNVRWCDIGGQEELKLKLRQAVEWPLKYEHSFKRLGIVPPRGILMFGPPGCSKTMIAKALATESKLNFISVKGPELFSKWVGESEKAVREVFRRARQVAPSIIFFDELDAIGCERHNTSAGTNVEERVLAQLLTELDGVESLGNVTIVAATNRLDRIDPALLRPGRFDRIIYVPLPDAETRNQIFSIQFKKTPVATDVDLNELVGKTEGYSGAEIVAVCHEAALKALEEDFESKFVLRRHFLIALKIILPRTPKSLINIYEQHLCK